MGLSAPLRLVAWNAATRERLRFGLYASHLLTLFGIALSNVTLGLGLVLFPALREPGEAGFRRARPLLVAAAVYAALLAVAVLFSQDPATSFDALRELFTLAALPLAIGSIAGERRLRGMFDAAILAAALAAGAGLAQFWIGFGDLDRRIRGPFSHVMTFSGILLLVDLVLIARLMFRPREASAVAGRWRWLGAPWLAWVALVTINLALVGSLTRNAWIGLAFGGGWLLWMRRRRLLLWILPAAAAFIVLAPVPVLARALSVANLSDESSYDRLCMLEAGARMVAEHPLFGVGPNMAERLYPIYRHTSAARLNVPHLHDSYAQLAAERGLPALASYLALLAVALGRAWRGYRVERDSGDGSRADLWLGVTAALLAFALASFFEHNWGDVEVQRVALLLLAAPFCLEIGAGSKVKAGSAT
ncbi:MAG: O-antigen ligase family protein [Thermoanaerobaculia bacterium]|nr:O-antigen ligase family protein [Thermoanaerobaculia bacterium]